MVGLSAPVPPSASMRAAAKSPETRLVVLSTRGRRRDGIVLSRRGVYVGRSLGEVRPVGRRWV